MKKVLLAAIGLACFGVLSFFHVGEFWKEPRALEVHIPYNDPNGFRKVSLRLQKEGFIPSAKYFRFLAKVSGMDKRVSPGYYDLNNQMGTLKTLFYLRHANAKQIKVTILEGHDLYDVADTLVEQGVIDSAAGFLQLAKSKPWIETLKSELNLPIHYSIEGFLYPDTYQIKKGAPVRALLTVALSNFKNKIHQKYRGNISPQAYYKALIAASLIEKETSVLDERPLVSSVIENRLKKKMKLRFDPTIIYAIKDMGLVQSNLKHGKINIKRSHFTLSSVYNTYYIKGFPPTPICSPTVESVEAYFNPAKTDYLFFVAEGGDSKRHVFTTTYKEHLYYVKQYQQRQQRQ